MILMVYLDRHASGYAVLCCAVRFTEILHKIRSDLQYTKRGELHWGQHTVLVQTAIYEVLTLV